MDSSIKTPGIFQFNMKEILDALKPIILEVANPIDNKYKGKYTIETIENGTFKWKEFISEEEGKDAKKKIFLDGVEKELKVKQITTHRRKIIRKEDEGKEIKFIFQILNLKTYILEKLEEVEYKEVDEEKSIPGKPPVYKKNDQGVEIVTKQNFSYTYLFEEVTPEYTFEQYLYKTDFFSTAYRVRNYSEGKVKEEMNFTFVNKNHTDGYFTSPNFQFVDIDNYENVPNKFFDSVQNEGTTDPIIDSISNLFFNIYVYNNGTPSKQLNNIFYNHHHRNEIIDSNAHLHFNDHNPVGFLMSLSRKYLPISWQINKNGTDITYDMVLAKIVSKEPEDSILLNMPKVISVKDTIGSLKKVYVEEVKDLIKKELSKYYGKYKFTLSEYKKDNEIKITDPYKLLKHFVKVKFEWPENIWKAWTVWSTYEQNIYNLHAHLFEDIDYDTASFIIKLGFILGLQAHIDNSDYKSSSKKKVSKIQISEDSFSKVSLDFFHDISDHPDKRQVLIDNFNKIFLGKYDEIKKYSNEITLQQSVSKQEEVIKERFLGKDKKSTVEGAYSVNVPVSKYISALNPYKVYAQTPQDSLNGFLRTTLIGGIGAATYSAVTTGVYATATSVIGGVASIPGGLYLLGGFAMTNPVAAVGYGVASLALYAGIVSSINTNRLGLRTALDSTGKFFDGTSKAVFGALYDTFDFAGYIAKKITGMPVDGIFQLQIEDEKAALNEYKDYKKELQKLTKFKNILYFLTNFGAFDIYGDMSVTISDVKEILEKVEALQNINDVHKLFEVLSVKQFTGQTENIKYIVVEQQSEKKTSKKSSKKILPVRKTYIQLYKFDLGLIQNLKATETIEIYCSLESMSKLFQRDIKSDVYELMNFFNLDNNIENYLLIKLNDKKTNETSYWIYGHLNNIQTQAQTYYESTPYTIVNNPLKVSYDQTFGKLYTAGIQAYNRLLPEDTTDDKKKTEEKFLKTLLNTDNFKGVIHRKQKLYDINLKKSVLVNLIKKGNEIVKNNSYTIIKTTTDVYNTADNYLTKNSMTFNEEENFKKIQKVFNEFLKRDYEKVNVIHSKNSITNMKRNLYWIFLQKYYSIYNSETNNVLNLKNEMITKVVTKLGNCNKPLDSDTELKTGLIENVLTESMNKVKNPSSKKTTGGKNQRRTKKNLKSK
jgi:hypothetical protein